MFIHLALIGILTVYCISYALQRSEKMTCMVGMMVAMTIGMLSSFSFGIILGASNHDLVISSILSVVLGLLVGFTTGRPVSLMAMIDGMTAGIMGGFMGSMLGVMLNVSNTLIWFIDVVFVVIMFMLMGMIQQETTPKSKAPLSTLKLLRRFLFQLGIVMIGFFYIGKLLGLH